MRLAPSIRGAGGKGSKTPRTAPDSIFTNSVGTVVDLISEGECEGLVDGNRSILYNEVPWQAPDGQFNFQGVQVVVNNGRPDQPALPGFDDVKSTVQVNQDLPAGVNKTISFPNDGTITRAIVTILGQQFFEVEKDGDTVGSRVDFVIEVSENGGAFQSAFSGAIVGKQTGEWSLDYPVAISQPYGQTAIRVRRITADPGSLQINNAISFRAYTKVVELKLRYPNLAVAGHTFDAKQFGNQIATRQYHWRGIKCRVPTNYNAQTRAYTGPFTGAFTTTKVYTNNPAYQLLELVTNKRFGLGKFIDPALIDLPSIYTAAKWCDDLVPDGKGGQEPRWTCNTQITTRGEAFSLLSQLVSCFRGTLFWMQAKLWAIGDQPRTASKIVTNANVEGGKFTYSGESNRRRYSVVNVAYSDPDLLYRRGIETVEDPTLIRELGYKPTDFAGFGCTSRAQAQRLGRSILFSQEFESELVSYTASFDHMAVDGDGPLGLAPGDLILIADRNRGNSVAGGRILASGAELLLDREAGTGTGQLYVEHASDGSIEYIPCTYSDVTTSVQGEERQVGRITLTGTPVQPVAKGDLYILISAGNVAEPFIVLKIEERDSNKLVVMAVRYDPDRYAAIYENVHIDTDQYMTLPRADVCAPASDVTLVENFLTGVDGYQRILDVTWVASPDRLLSHYDVAYRRGDSDWVELPRTTGVGTRIPDVRPGAYEVRVIAINRAGREALPAFGSYVIDAVPTDEVLTLGAITNLSLQNTTGTTFGGRDARFTWTVNTPQSQYMADVGITEEPDIDGLADPLFRDCLVIVRSADGAIILREESVVGTDYTYTFEKNFADTLGSPRRAFRIDVLYRDKYGRVSDPATLTVSNPQPEFPSSPTLTPGLQTFTVQAVRPEDTDFAGMAVYASLTSGFTPGPGNQVYRGSDIYASIVQLGNTRHYVRVQPFDAYGPGVMTGQLTVDTSQGQIGDIEAPLAPTGLNLSTNITTGPTGDPVVQLVANWSPSSASDLGGYTLAIAEGSTSFFIELALGATSTTYTREVRPNVTYYAKVAAVDKAGNRSAFSPVVSTLSARDTVPPAAPTSAYIQVGYRQLWVSWTNPTAADLSSAEIYENTSNDAFNATLIGTVNAESGQVGKFSVPGQINSTRYYWIKAVDTSGNKSGFSQVVSGTPAAVQMAEVAGQVQAAQIAAVEAGKITGQITETQIGPEAVTTPKLAARSIVAGKIAVEGIQAENIAAYAIVAGKIAANAIIAENIVAGAITGDRIKAGTVEGNVFSTGTSLPGTIKVGNTGVEIGTIQQQASYANDPAARINAMTTTIQPGRIAIGGSSTLVSLLTGPDNTQINGGKIATNTILANSIRIGNRNISMQRSDFYYNPNSASLNWTNGELLFVNDSGNPAAHYFADGGTGWQGGTVNFVYWLPYEGFFRVGVDNWPSILAAGGVIICEWRNFGNFHLTMGGTIIDGGRIFTNTITALQIKAGSITADRMAVTSLSAITANIGSLVSYNGSGGRVERDGNGTRVYYNNGNLALKLGF